MKLEKDFYQQVWLKRKEELMSCSELNSPVHLEEQPGNTSVSLIHQLHVCMHVFIHVHVPKCVCMCQPASPLTSLRQDLLNLEVGWHLACPRSPRFSHLQCWGYRRVLAVMPGFLCRSWGF